MDLWKIRVVMVFLFVQPISVSSKQYFFFVALKGIQEDLSRMWIRPTRVLLKKCICTSSFHLFKLGSQAALYSFPWNDWHVRLIDMLNWDDPSVKAKKSSSSNLKFTVESHHSNYCIYFWRIGQTNLWKSFSKKSPNGRSPNVFITFRYHKLLQYIWGSG